MWIASLKRPTIRYGLRAYEAIELVGMYQVYVPSEWLACCDLHQLGRN